MDAALTRRPLAVPAQGGAVPGLDDPELAVGLACPSCAATIRGVQRNEGSGLAIIQPCGCAV